MEDLLLVGHHLKILLGNSKMATSICTYENDMLEWLYHCVVSKMNLFLIKLPLFELFVEMEYAIYEKGIQDGSLLYSIRLVI